MDKNSKKLKANKNVLNKEFNSRCRVCWVVWLASPPLQWLHYSLLLSYNVVTEENASAYFKGKGQLRMMMMMMLMYVVLSICFAHFHFNFQVPTFPQLSFHDPAPSKKAVVVCCTFSCWFLRVGGSSESVDQASVKRKSCSPDSQTSTCLFSASVGVSAHCHWALPAWCASDGDKRWLRKKSCVMETHSKHLL